MYSYAKKPISYFGKVITGKTPPKKVDTAFGDLYPFITPKDLDGRKSIVATERSLSEDGILSVKNNVIPPSSVVVSCIGSDMGKAALSTKTSVTNQQLNSIIVDSINHNPEYVYYALSLEKSALMKAAGGTTMPILNKSSFESYEIYAPTRKQQDKIVGLIKPLDDKIANNTAMNQTLEKIAQRIFKSWFIDFDPVKANKEGVAFDGLSPEIQALFPSEFEESELGMIPKGWKSGYLGDFTKAQGGFAYKSKSFIDSGNPVVKIKNILNDRTVNLADCQCIDNDLANSTEKFQLVDGDILMAMTGATVAKSGLYVSDGRTSYLNQRVARFKSALPIETHFFTYLNVNQMRTFDTIVKTAHGSAQPNISTKGIEQTPIIVPSVAVINKFEEMITPLFTKVISNTKQNVTLAKVRDRLLPKLISGQITVGEAQKELAEAI